MPKQTRKTSSAKAPAPKKRASKSKKNAVVILPSFLDIGSCEDLHRTLSDALTGLNKPLVIEAGEVERITTPAIQLILATGLAAEALSQQCTIGHPSEAMERSFAELGLTAELEKRRA